MSVRGHRHIRNRAIIPAGAFVASALVLAADAQHVPGRKELERLIRDRVDSGMATGIVVGVLEADGTHTAQATNAAGRVGRWLGGRESNPDMLVQSQLSYH